MIVVAFDPVSGELVLDREDGSPPMLLARTPRVLVKIYHETYLGAVVSAESVELLYEAVSEEPLIVTVVPVEAGHWRLAFHPIN